LLNHFPQQQQRRDFRFWVPRGLAAGAAFRDFRERMTAIDAKNRRSLFPYLPIFDSPSRYIWRKVTSLFVTNSEILPIMVAKKTQKRHGRKSTSGSDGGPPSKSAAVPLREVLAVELSGLLATRRMSKQEFADKTGFTLKYVEGLLSGKDSRVGIDELETMSNVLGVDVSALVRRRGSPGA
jgi:DNA-binding Xre family transcriptional regulator